MSLVELMDIKSEYKNLDITNSLKEKFLTFTSTSKNKKYLKRT